MKKVIIILLCLILLGCSDENAWLSGELDAYCKADISLIYLLPTYPTSELVIINKYMHEYLKVENIENLSNNKYTITFSLPDVSNVENISDMFLEAKTVGEYPDIIKYGFEQSKERYKFNIDINVNNKIIQPVDGDELVPISLLIDNFEKQVIKNE